MQVAYLAIQFPDNQRLDVPLALDKVDMVYQDVERFKGENCSMGMKMWIYGGGSAVPTDKERDDSRLAKGVL
jgi:hypothetical protein